MEFTVTWSGPKKFNDDNFANLNFDGVYLIGYRNLETDKRFPVYVGQDLIKDRLSDHYKNNKCIKDKVFKSGRSPYYRYAKVSDENNRLDIEFGLYNNHGKTKLCNEIEPPSSGPYEKNDIIVKESFPKE